jgi:hypothetical protein
MTRNVLIGRVLAGILFACHLGFADDQPKESNTASGEQIGSVEGPRSHYRAGRHLFDRRLQPFLRARLVRTALLRIL